MSAAYSEVRLGCTGASLRALCHGLGRRVNNLTMPSQRIARELSIHIRTSYRWCWWLRNAALSYEMHRQLEGTVEADDLYPFGQKTQTRLFPGIYGPATLAQRLDFPLPIPHTHLAQ